MAISIALDSMQLSTLMNGSARALVSRSQSQLLTRTRVMQTQVKLYVPGRQFDLPSIMRKMSTILIAVVERALNS